MLAALNDGGIVEDMLETSTAVAGRANFSSYRIIIPWSVKKKGQRLHSNVSHFAAVFALVNAGLCQSSSLLHCIHIKYHAWWNTSHVTDSSYSRRHYNDLSCERQGYSSDSLFASAYAF